MGRIVDYKTVLRQAETLGLTCVYYNTGAFGFTADAAVHVVGWLGPDDPTIRPGLAADGARVATPYPQRLAERLGRAWPALIDGEAWLMPKSHWAFELDHGNGPWLTPALTAAGVDVDALRGRTDGSAVAFAAGDRRLLELARALLATLSTSDFALLFPGHRHLATLHHRQHIWWQTPDPAMAERLRRLPEPPDA